MDNDSDNGIDKSLDSASDNHLSSEERHQGSRITGDSGSEATPPKAANTGQIPLLDDVVFDTEFPFTKPKTSKSTLNTSTAAADPLPSSALPSSPSPLEAEQAIPRATDLFGGSPDTAQSGPMSPSYQATDLDNLRNTTEQMVDSLVAEYSAEIVSRLKQELTTLLDDLQDSAASGADKVSLDQGPDQT